MRQPKRLDCDELVSLLKRRALRGDREEMRTLCNSLLTLARGINSSIAYTVAMCCKKLDN